MKRALVYGTSALSRLRSYQVENLARFSTKSAFRPFFSPCVDEAGSWGRHHEKKHNRRRKREESLSSRYFSASASPKKGTDDMAQEQEYGGFEKIWVRAKNRALSLHKRPVGSLESHHWLEIVELLKLLPSLHTARGDRVVDAFLLLNRLKTELDFIRSSSPDDGKKELDGMTFIPLEEDAMIPVIHAWRDSCLLSSSSQSSWSLSQLSTKPTTLLRVIANLKKVGLFQNTVEAYNRLIASLRKFPDRIEAAHQAEDILKFLLTNSTGEELPRDSPSHPNETTIRHVVALWANSGHPQAYRKVEHYYNLLTQWLNESGRDSFRMSAPLLCSVMEAYSKSAPPEVAFPRIQELQMEMKFTDSTDLISWNRVCHALADCHHPQAADAILEIMNRLKDTALSNAKLSWGESMEVIHPDNSTFLAAIKALGRAGRAKEALNMFDELEGLAEELDDPSFLPETAHYSALIWAYAKVGDTVGARSMFARLRKRSEKDGRVRLDNQAIHGVLVAWAESGDPYGPEEAINFLNEMVEDTIAFIDTRVFNILMKSFSGRNSPEGAVRAEECFEMMRERNIQPDRDTFLNLISAWANAGEPEKSESILHYCFREAKSGTLDNTVIDLQHFHVVLNAWEHSEKSEAAQRALEVFDAIKDYGLQPNILCYSAMFGVLWRSDPPQVLQLTHQIAEDLVRKLDEDDQLHLNPDTICLNKAILAMSKAKSTSDLQKVHDFFQKFLEHGVKPNNATYSILMGVSSKMNRPRETDAFFREMLKSGDTSLSPDRKTYSTRLTAWSRNGNPDKTLKVLNEWKEASETGLVEKPSQRDFDAILVAWEKSSASDAPIHAEKELERRILSSASAKEEDLDEGPTLQSFNSVISAHAKSKSPDAGKRALAVFQRLLSMEKSREGARLEPDFWSYSGTIIALSHSSDPLALEAVKMLLQDLNSKGQNFWGKLGNAEKLVSNLKYAVKKSQFPSSDREEMTKTIAKFFTRLSGTPDARKVRRSA